MLNTLDQVRSQIRWRIQRGTITNKLLAARSGLGQSHLSSFTHGRKSLSAPALDALLRALGMHFELVPLESAETQPPAPRGRIANLPGNPRHGRNAITLRAYDTAHNPHD
jgi:transcriptional regulator with XRE-family HTH domain